MCSSRTRTDLAVKSFTFVAVQCFVVRAFFVLQKCFYAIIQADNFSRYYSLAFKLNYLSSWFKSTVLFFYSCYFC